MRVEFFATPCMLESWLLGDLDAVRTVAANRGYGVPIAPLNIEIPNATLLGTKMYLPRCSHILGSQQRLVFMRKSQPARI